jgi:hypothetical protein
MIVLDQNKTIIHFNKQNQNILMNKMVTHIYMLLYKEDIWK